eukprot:364988-Chlamydomonas_euryale.AAC.9
MLWRSNTRTGRWELAPGPSRSRPSDAMRSPHDIPGSKPMPESAPPPPPRRRRASWRTNAANSSAAPAMAATHSRRAQAAR